MITGMISKLDGEVLAKTFDLIFQEFTDDYIYVCEIGIFDGKTANGMKDYCLQNKKTIVYTGIDSEKDKLVKPPFDTAKVIRGRSDEVYNQIEDESQHLIFVDGDHSKLGVISDYYAYKDKVKMGGYLCFHDTGFHIKPFKDFQHGDKNNHDAYISVRKALHDIGLLEPFTNKNYRNVEGGIYDQWEVVFDEADPTDEAGGITVFKKLY